MAEIPELLPCPCCGGKARLVKKEGYGPAGGKYSRGYVTCQKCDLTTPTKSPFGKAVERWNSRSDSAILAAEERGGKEERERCAGIARLDADWIKRDGKQKTSWGRGGDVFTLPAEGIPWDHVGTWSYRMGIVAGENIAAAIMGEDNGE